MRVVGLLVVLGFLLMISAVRAEGQESPDQTPAPGEALIERRLLAPCCWNQTLDVHESELAASLRHEIRERLHAGEPQSVIEDSLAARYGEKIRAVEKGQDPGGSLPYFVGIGALFTAVSLLVVLRRWRRAGTRIRSVETKKPSDDESVGGPEDARLDDELRALDQ